MYREHPDELVSLDCETTSLNPADAELLSIGAVKLRGNRILASEALYLLVRPEQAPQADNVRITVCGLSMSVRACRPRTPCGGCWIFHRRPAAAGLLPGIRPGGAQPLRPPLAGRASAAAAHRDFRTLLRLQAETEPGRPHRP
ncbi:hypothetical protein JOS77_26790 [Chromobacterium haemolyticum]|nr:hypothetical protein JOS77_26790 [Chromobacterium haemolyticum]